jgi:hypothetical protein
MEPAIIEMNVPVAIAVIIGMIGWFSWQVSKNFENYLRVNPTMAGDGLVGVEDSSAEVEESAEEDMEVEEEEAVEEAVAEQEDAGAVEQVVAEVDLGDTAHVDEVLEVEMDTNDTTQAHVQTDIDIFHARIEEIDNKLEVTRSLVTELCKTVIDTNDSTKNHFNKTFDTLENKMITNTAANLSRIESSTSGSLSTFRNTLDNYAKSQQVVTDVLSSVQISLGNFVTNRDFNDLKVQMEELLKRSTVRKSVYQAWNGSSKWTDFNEGELNIQMIRKKFMTTEQNEEWLLPENKKIAAYNRDQLLGLNEDTWTTTDNTIFVKRYYKDDWDSSIEVAITVTLSKKILVPPGGKPEIIISHILKKLYEKDQITWEHLLVNV